MTKKYLLQAIDAVGGQSQLADALNIKQGHVGMWVHRDKKAPPAEYVLKIEEITGISRHKLRPDVFGDDQEED
ncbi:hypothetical protein GCM10007161_13140 [Ignatzschineria indica]|uniref:Cytoplasmic chaperone TorD n=1 Tax=Ignatzschineria indica TaxID=472583 RepID=A0A2U2AJS1_9GAMM|nr:YdaS family helix-turn-helix protein [Ignatzschineria indica]PWD83085.1 cytoplasmic chaperone TorD [Ignatzschineria indica]GGZ83059.1 hypothetical protein GCM10007161_13140 [Ignatzschineria indica]